MTTGALGASLIVSGVSLASGLLAIVSVERFDRARIRASVLTQRWLTWVAIAAVVLVGVAGGLAALVVLFALLAGVASWELAELQHLSRPATGAAAVGAGALVVGIALDHPFAPAATVAAIAPIVTAGLLSRGRVIDRTIVVIGSIGVAVALGLGPRIVADIEGGPALLAATLFAVAIGDVGAYVAGRSLGGPRLAPRVSPNKRWSGLLGNLAGALLAFVAFALLTQGRVAGAWLVLPWLIAPASVAGDLLESAVKRHAAVKDAGSWLPGFGGLLDRIDSSLLALPAAYAAAVLLG